MKWPDLSHENRWQFLLGSQYMIKISNDVVYEIEKRLFSCIFIVVDSCYNEKANW